MINITEADWEERKAFVNFGPEDEAILRELHLVARTYADEVMDILYQRWMQCPALQHFFPDQETLARVKGLQKKYFVSLTEGRYGSEYLAHRVYIGQVHKRIGLLPRWYMGAYAIYLEIVLPKAMAEFEYDKCKQRRAVTALTKLITLDQELALTAYYNG